MEAPVIKKDSDIPEGLMHNPRSDLEAEFMKAKIETEGRILNCVTPDKKRASQVEVTEVSEILGKGNFAEWVAAVKVCPYTDGREKVVSEMVMKKFKSSEFQDGEVSLDTSIQNYMIVKAAGIPTWTTYRRVEGEPMVLMTTGVNQKSNETFVTYNDPDDIIEKRIHIESEALDVQNLVNQIVSICRKAADNYIALSPDSFGYLVTDEDEKTGVKVIISDFDMLDNMEGFGYSYIFTENVKAAKKSIHGVFNHQGEGLEKTILDMLDVAQP